jgi:transposase-like protein
VTTGAYNADYRLHERLHRGSRRRLRVVRISPSEEAYVRLVGCHLIEYAEDWTTARSYIQAESIELCRAKLKRTAQGLRE